MLAFQIFINGRKVTIAGADDLVVLSAIVSAVGKLEKKHLVSNIAKDIILV